jgi:hypothetical protein
MFPKLLCMLLLALLPVCASAGGIDSATFSKLDKYRIQTNIKGMWALGSWGLMHTVVGLKGASVEHHEEQYFHQMNAAWGIINLGIAGLGYLGARQELKRSYSSVSALHRYEATKRLYLINAGLDGLYIATGLYFTEHAKQGGEDAAMYRGFGNSLILQGLGLLAFDVVMFSAHQGKDKAWYRALEALSVTGNGIGWRYVIR